MRLLAAGVLCVLMGSAADAAPRREELRARPDARLAALEDAATACFAGGILGNARAVSLARAGRWYEAAGLTASLCRPEVGAMVRRRDEVQGYGSGHRHFTGPYLRALERALAARIRPVLEASAGSGETP